MFNLPKNKMKRNVSHFTEILGLSGIQRASENYQSVYVICYEILYTDSYAHYPQSYQHRYNHEKSGVCEINGGKWALVANRLPGAGK
jgi:hypothetical protein